MKCRTVVACFAAVIGVCFASENVLNVDESKLPDLRPSETADPRSSNNLWASAARSVNLSFFIPAFSLFALASQLMPQMFPSLTTATTSSRGFARRQQQQQPQVPPVVQAAEARRSMRRGTGRLKKNAA